MNVKAVNPDMELLICALAALAAGIGTGLAGLSAATVMVPVMIVLCPSFAGETAPPSKADGGAAENSFTAR